MLPSVRRLYRKEGLLAARYRNAGLSKSPPSARSAQVRPSHDVMLSCLRALEPSCSHVLMDSCSRTLELRCPLAIVPPRAHRKSLITLRFIVPMVSCLICSESVAALFSIPRESIRSLSNSLPVLARTGFENRAPVEAGSAFLGNKGFLNRERSQELPKSSQDPSKSPPRGPKSCQRGSKGTPKTFQEHQKRYHSLIVSQPYRFIVSCSHSRIVPQSHRLITP